MVEHLPPLAQPGPLRLAIHWASFSSCSLLSSLAATPRRAAAPLAAPDMADTRDRTLSSYKYCIKVHLFIYRVSKKMTLAHEIPPCALREITPQNRGFFWTCCSFSTQNIGQPRACNKSVLSQARSSEQRAALRIALRLDHQTLSALFGVHSVLQYTNCER